MYFFLTGMSGLLSNADDKVIGNLVSMERSIFGNALNIIRIFGTGLALIMLTWMSISYFTADGRGAPWSIERKADIKGRQLKNFAIGVGIFIGASNLLYYIATFVEDIITRAG